METLLARDPRRRDPLRPELRLPDRCGPPSPHQGLRCEDGRRGSRGQTPRIPVGCAAPGLPDSGRGGAAKIVVHRGARLLCLVQGWGRHFTLLPKHKGTCPEATGQGRNCPSG